MPAGEDVNTAPMTEFPDKYGLRYYSINRFYREQFGEKVYKIAVAVAYTCPNRAATGHGCIFCDQWGSAGVHSTMNLPLEEQITKNREFLAKRYRVSKFLVYFQAFSNTYNRISELKSNMELALAQPFVHGLIIGTRPDCLPEETIELFETVSKKTFLSVELGVQTFDDKQLRFLKRGHTARQSREAIHRLKDRTDVHIGIHLIFGLPGETDGDIIKTAETVNNLPVDSVKLHNLHVLKNTPLETEFKEDRFQPLDLETYADRVILFLEHLSPDIPVQRLAAYAGPDMGLLAPEWTGDRMMPATTIQKRMAERDTGQGFRFEKQVST